MNILDAKLYESPGGLNEGEPLVELIPAEPVSNDYLEQVVAPYVHNVRALRRLTTTERRKT